MNGDAVGAVMFFLFLGALILVPIYLRNRLMQKQLDTIAAAIERGIDPERIKTSLPVPERTADLNGNWKASMILIGLGLTYVLLIAIPAMAAQEGKSGAEAVAVFLPGAVLIVLGGILMHIHRTVVGKVVSIENNGIIESKDTLVHRNDPE